MQFDFIAEKGQGKKQRDQATKHLIRKRATQAAALTKRKEGKIRLSNPLQLPPWVVKDSARAEPEDGGIRSGSALSTPTIVNQLQLNADYGGGRLQTPTDDLPQSLPLITYTESIVSFLSAPAVQAHLVGLLLGRFNLTKDRIRVGKMLKLSDPDFLSQLSAKYGESPVLDAAIICLVARIKELLNAPVPVESPRYLYGCALRTLQQSLCVESTEQMENIWFTTPTLALFELLDASSHTPWILHTKAAVNMLRSVGACNIITEAQKILLATQTPIMIIEAMMSAGTCFLDEPEWQLALQANIAEAPPFRLRSEMVVSQFMWAAKLPNLFNEVTDAVRTSSTSVLPDLERRLRDVKSASAIWNTRWKDMLSYTYNDPELEARRVFHRTHSYSYAAIVDRLLLALDTSQYLELETTALSNARKATEVADLASSVRLAYARVVSDSVISTSVQWQECCMFSTEQVVGKSLFLDWARRMERPVEAAPR